MDGWILLSRYLIPGDRRLVVRRLGRPQRPTLEAASPSVCVDGFENAVNITRCGLEKITFFLKKNIADFEKKRSGGKLKG